MSARHISWTTPKGTEYGLRMPRHRRDGCGRIAARSSWRSRPLIEIGEAQCSLRRELSAGSSDEGKLLKRGARRCGNERSLGGRRRRQRVSLGSRAGRFRNRAAISKKVENDEADIARLIDEALSLAEEIVWAVEQPGDSAALLLALLWERNQRVFYVPGLSVDRARDTYRGESKTDARDAHVIAYPRRE
jgi:hypothetical protein